MFDHSLVIGRSKLDNSSEKVSHLIGMALPSLPFQSTHGTIELLSCKGITIIYCFPKISNPEKPLEDWDLIPGAKGCTAESCSYRDLYAQYQAKGINVYGLSTQSLDYQLAAAERLHLPYPLISDNDLSFTDALSLPTFNFMDMKLIQRLTLLCENGKIKKVFFPVTEPIKNADEVLHYIKKNYELESIPTA